MERIPAPKGLTKKKRIFNVPTAEAEGCGPFAPPESVEDCLLFDELFNDNLIRKNPWLASSAQVPARNDIEGRFCNHFHVTSTSAEVRGELSG